MTNLRILFLQTEYDTYEGGKKKPEGTHSLAMTCVHTFKDTIKTFVWNTKGWLLALGPQLGIILTSSQQSHMEVCSERRGV